MKRAATLETNTDVWGEWSVCLSKGGLHWCSGELEYIGFESQYRTLLITRSVFEDTTQYLKQ